MDRESIYLRLPVAAQHGVVSLEGLRIQRSRFNREFQDLLTECRDRVRWSTARIAEYRDARLHRFMLHAHATMPYYRERNAAMGIDPRDIRRLEDLRQVPLLTRAEVQAAGRGLESDRVPRRSTLPCHTSGSTGSGLHFPATWRSHREQWAVWWRCWMEHGLLPGTPCLHVGGRSIVPLAQRKPPYWRYNHVGRQVFFSSYHLNDETAPDYLAEMRRSRARWLHGYPSMVSLLAQYARSLGVRLDLQWVTLGAENVLPHQVEAIRGAFGIEPIQHYGMAEAAANISLCRRGSLHVDEDFAAVEFVPIEGAQYRIVGTNVSNDAYGLFRYEVGDIATITGRTCDCGQPGRVVDGIDGRQEDFVITKSGARLGRLDHVFKDLVRVREAQIRQSEPGRMTVAIVRADGYGEQDDQALRAEVVKRVGDEVAFDIVYTDAIPRTSRGKLRFVVSTLADGQIEAER